MDPMNEIVEHKGTALPVDILAPTPMAMLNRAIAQGASIEILTKLMDLQERHEKNIARKAFDEAMASVKTALPPIIKNQTGHNSKTYADLSAIIDACEEARADNGRAIIQAPISNEHGAGVETMLLHSSGQFLAECLILPAVKDDPQGLGSCIVLGI